MMNRAEQNWPTDETIEITEEQELYRSAAKVILYDNELLQCVRIDTGGRVV
jgi:hypothetical protein